MNYDPPSTDDLLGSIADRIAEIVPIAERIAIALERVTAPCGRTLGPSTCGRMKIQCDGYHRDAETGVEWFSR